MSGIIYLTLAVAIPLGVSVLVAYLCPPDDEGEE